MANEPQDYSGIFHEDLDTKTNATDATPQGFLIPAGMDTDQEAHADNLEHILRFWFTSDAQTNPFPAPNKIKTDTWRAFQSAAQYLAGHLHGWRELDARYGGPFYTPFNTAYYFKVASASGTTLALYCAGESGDAVDPRNNLAWAGISFDSSDPLGTPESVGDGGCPVMPWGLVRFFNSALGDGDDVNSRCECCIVRPNFDSLPAEVSASDTFTLELDQDVSNCTIKLDEDRPVIAEINGEFQKPPAWVELHDLYVIPMKERIAEYTEADWGESKVIELKTLGATSCRCAFPVRTRQNGWRIWGTFKIEVSADDGASYRDITHLWDRGPGIYPRFQVSGKMRVNEKTELMLGPQGESDPADYTEGINKIRVRYMYPVANMSIEGSRNPLQMFCHHSRRDYMNFVGSISALTAKDIDDDGNHWFCNKHRVIPEANRSNYTWDCAQCGTCPQFKLREISRCDENAVAQFTNGQDLILKQTTPGESTVMDFAYFRPEDGTPSIVWGMNPAVVYGSNYDAAYAARIFAQSGGFVFVDADDPYYLTGDDQNLRQIAGAFWNFYADMSGADFESDRFLGGDLMGILPRRMGDSFIPLTQFSETRADDNDPVRQLHGERLGRKVAMIRRDVREGPAIAFSDRDKAGIEGENRIQRVREIVKYVSGVDLETQGLYGSAKYESAFVYTTPVIVRGVTNVKVLLKLKADGKASHGHKRIGQTGINGSVKRAESIGGGLIRIHCAPGIWLSSYIDGVSGARFTQAVPWYGAGNVVAFPPHWAPDGAISNSINAKLFGSLSGKAVAGDDVEFALAALAGRRFLIEKAEPGAGDDFSDAETDTFFQRETLGPFARFDEYFTDDAAPLIELAKYELQYGGSVIGTWTDFTELVKSFPNSQRPYATIGDPLTGPPYALWDWITNLDESKYAAYATIYQGGDGHTVIEFDEDPGLAVGSVIHIRNSNNSGESDGNHTITGFTSPTVYITNRTGLSLAGYGPGGEWIKVQAGNFLQVGSGRVYFDLPVFGLITLNAGILLGGYNKARITLKVDGAEQTPKVVTIQTPFMTPQLAVNVDAIASIQVWHQNRMTGAWTQLSFAGIVSSTFDIFLNQSPFTYKFYTDHAGSERFLFSPLLAGDEVIVIYKTTEPVSLDGFGEPGVFTRSFQSISDSGYLKKCDLIDLRDDPDGSLAAQAANLNNSEFKVSTAAVIDTITALAKQTVGGGAFAAIDAGHYKAFTDGWIVIKAEAFE